ncbi:hypothetical protein PFISCL1PPCAC_5493, partial [Pristionchus fissidentatus]
PSLHWFHSSMSGEREENKEEGKKIEDKKEDTNMPVLESILTAAPAIITSLLGGGNREGEAERRQMDAEMEKKRLENDAEKMRMNLETMRSIQEQNANTMSEITRGHTEMLRQLDESTRLREDESRKEAKELREKQLEKENEMRNASREEREKMREEYKSMEKEKEDELRTIREVNKQEKKEERERYETMKKEAAEMERTLRERMMEQEKEQSKVLQQLMEKHGLEIKELNELRLEDSKQYAVMMESHFREQIEEAARNAQIQTQLLICHYTAKENATLAEHFNIFRVIFSNVRTIHMESIKHLTTATEDDRATSLGRAEGTIEILSRELDRLDTSKNTVLAALDKASSLPIEVRMNQKKFIDFVSNSINLYSSSNQLLVGKIKADPPRKITAGEVDKLCVNFDKLSSSMNEIPLLPITEDFMHKIANGSTATTKAITSD